MEAAYVDITYPYLHTTCRVLTKPTPVYFFTDPDDICSITTEILPTDAFLYVTAPKATDEDPTKRCSWRVPDNLCNILWYAPELDGKYYANFDLIWNNSVTADVDKD